MSALLIDASECDEVAAFLTAFPGGGGDLGYWRRRLQMWWEDNPAFGPGVPRGWILRGGSGNGVVGFLGNVASMFRFAGENRRVFNATTWRVHPNHRGGSLHLYLANVEAAGKSGALMFNTTPNEDVVKVLQYYRFTSLPSYPSGRVFMAPLRASAVARAWLRDKEKVPPVLRSLVGVPLWAAALPLDLQLWRGRSCAVRVADRADSAYDALWDRTRDAFRYTSVRDAAKINWLSGGPFKRTLIEHRQGDTVQGYALLGDSSWRGLRVLELLDLWIDWWQSDHLAHALIAGVHAYARQSGYDLLALHDYSASLGALYRGLGLFFTSADDRRHFFGAGDAPLPPMTSANVYFSALEGDLAV